jgi:sterol desaturase/sphingolipid hydroxylase (fatty acid hydroxylase superfamily)
VTDLVIPAIPFFLLFLALEALALRHAAHEHAEDPSRPVGYDLRDTRTSVVMGLVHLVMVGGLKLVLIGVFAALYELSPLRMPESAWWAWVILFFADDLSYYAYHRGHHRIRMLWATHVVHHSSQHYNFSTAVRQDWAPFTAPLFWIWLPLIGFKPWMIVLAQSWNLLYQFLLHTETVKKLPRPIELIFNTPSHHRVHHGVQDQYLDKNYGGILIIWDRLFGSFQGEGERVRYGLTTNIDTYNPIRVGYHEWHAMLRDVRRARTWRARFGHVLRGPGWAPASADGPALPDVGGSAHGEGGDDDRGGRTRGAAVEPEQGLLPRAG